MMFDRNFYTKTWQDGAPPYYWRAVNKLLKRPAWPFYSSDGIRKQIKHFSKLFAAVDLLQGYHQVPLHEDRGDITTFIVAQRRFRFMRMPMGLIYSGDFFNMVTDESIRNLEGILKSVMTASPRLKPCKNVKTFWEVYSWAAESTMLHSIPRNSKYARSGSEVFALMGNPRLQWG